MKNATRSNHRHHTLGGHVRRYIYCLLAIASTYAHGSTPLYQYEDVETTLYKLQYNSTVYDSCPKETKEALTSCFDDVFPTINVPGCGTYKGTYQNGRYYDFQGGDAYSSPTTVSFYAVAEVKPNNCNRYPNTSPYRSYSINQSTGTIQQLTCNAKFVDTANNEDLIFWPEQGSACIKIIGEEKGCQVDIKQSHGTYLGIGSDGSSINGWSGYSTGSTCDTCAPDDTNCQTQEVDVPTYQDEPDTDNPFYCGDDLDGNFFCVNTANHEEQPPTIDFADNRQGQGEETVPLSDESCSSISNGDYMICKEGLQPPENTNETSDDDRTQLSSVTVINNNGTTTTYITYMGAGSATDHGQPEEDINDTGGDTDGDGDSDGDLDGDGDSDNSDIISKLNEIKAQQRGTNSKLQAINESLNSGSGTSSGSCDTSPTCSGDPVGCAILTQQWHTMCQGSGSQGNGTSSGDCDIPPTCEGDPIQCAMLNQQWQTMCAYAQPADQAVLDQTGLDEFEGQAATEALHPTIDVSTALDTSGWLSRDCMPNIDIEAAGFEIVIPLADFCWFWQLFGYLLVAAASLTGARIVSGAF